MQESEDQRQKECKSLKISDRKNARSVTERMQEQGEKNARV